MMRGCKNPIPYLLLPRVSIFNAVFPLCSSAFNKVIIFSSFYEGVWFNDVIYVKTSCFYEKPCEILKFRCTPSNHIFFSKVL